MQHRPREKRLVAWLPTPNVTAAALRDQALAAGRWRARQARVPSRAASHAGSAKSARTASVIGQRERTPLSAQKARITTNSLPKKASGQRTLGPPKRQEPTLATATESSRIARK